MELPAFIAAVAIELHNYPSLLAAMASGTMLLVVALVVVLETLCLVHVSGVYRLPLLEPMAFVNLVVGAIWGVYFLIYVPLPPVAADLHPLQSVLRTMGSVVTTLAIIFGAPYMVYSTVSTTSDLHPQALPVSMVPVATRSVLSYILPRAFNGHNRTRSVPAASSSCGFWASSGYPLTEVVALSTPL